MESVVTSICFSHSYKEKTCQKSTAKKYILCGVLESTIMNMKSNWPQQPFFTKDETNNVTINNDVMLCKQNHKTGIWWFESFPAIWRVPWSKYLRIQWDITIWRFLFPYYSVLFFLSVYSVCMTFIACLPLSFSRPNHSFKDRKWHMLYSPLRKICDFKLYKLKWRDSYLVMHYSTMITFSIFSQLQFQIQFSVYTCQIWNLL